MAVKNTSVLTVFFAMISFVDTQDAHVVDLSCNLNLDLCNWRQSKKDDFDWAFETSNQYSKQDFSVADGKYLQIKANQGRGTSILMSDYQNKGSYCLTFWYKLSGQGVTMRVTTETHQSSIEHFERSATDLRGDWVFLKVSITRTSSFQISVLGEIRGGYFDMISVDDILFTPGSCSLDCDFDRDMCGWEDFPSTSQRFWGTIRRYESSYYADHTTGAGNFIRANIPSLSTVSTTAIISPLVDPGVYCFSFWFRMSSENNRLIVAHTVNEKDFGSYREKTGLPGQWNQAQYELRSVQSFKIIIEVSLKQTEQTHVDDVKLCQGTCKNGSTVIDCSFESGLCSWDQDSGDDSDWSRITGDESKNEAPAVDHTKEDHNGHYIYVAPVQSGKAIIKSPELSTGIYCFSLWYHMNGEGERHLNVQSQTRDMYRQILLNRSNNQGDEWRYIQSQINSSYSFKLMIVAIMSENSAGGIAVDDIHMCPGLCETEVSTLVEFYQPLALNGEEDVDLTEAGVIVNDTSAMVFEVKCRSDARILLQNSDTTIQVVIGGQKNTSVIRITKTEGQYTSYKKSNIVTASAYRAFWISWDDDVVRVGKGFIPLKWEFMRLNESHYNITSVSVQRSIYSDVYWRFHLDKFPRTTTTSVPTSTVSHSATSTRSTGIKVQSFTMPFTTLSRTTSGAHTTFNAEDDSEQSASPDTYTTQRPEKQSSDKMPVSDTGSLVAVVVATSCAFIIIFVIVLYLVWRKRKCTGKNQCWKSKPEIEGTTTAVMNKAYSDTSSVRFQNRTDVNGSLHNCNGAKDINLGFESQANDSEYNYITWNLEPTEENHTSRQIGQQQHIAANSGYSHLQNFNQGLKVMAYAHTNEIKFKLNGSVHESGTDNTYDAIPSAAQNNVEIKTVMKEDEIPTYDHASVSISEKKPNSGGKYTHVNELVKPINEKNIYAVPDKVVPKQEMKFQQNGSVHESGADITYDAIPSAAQNNVKIKTVMKEDEDPTYDHTSVSMSDKKPNSGGEYTHVNELVKPIIEQNIYAVPDDVVPKEETRSQKSATQKDKQHFLLCKPDDQSDKEMPSDTEDHVYFILEKPDINKK